MMNPWLQWVDSAALVAILGGLAHILIKVGSMNTKIDTMWEWWKNIRGPVKEYNR